MTVLYYNKQSLSNIGRPIR